MATTIVPLPVSESPSLLGALVDGVSVAGVLVAGAPADALHPREVVLLQTLMANQGRVVTRTELARAVGLRQQARRVDVHLVNVRRALDDRLINVRGRGWMVPTGYELNATWQAAIKAHLLANEMMSA